MKTESDNNSMESETTISFGEFRLDADGSLWCQDTLIHLTPKELAALRLLISYAGRVVAPLQLKHELWGDVHVTADSVPKCLSSLRAKLEPSECIQTIYKRGYRFTAELRRPDDPTAESLPRLAIVPFEVGYGVPEHLGIALAEETIARITCLEAPPLAVLARDSVFALAQRKQTAHQIGVTLKADLVLTGVIRALPAHLRLRAEMIRVSDGTQIWVEDVLVPQNQTSALEIELMRRLLMRHDSGHLAVNAALAPVYERDRRPEQREAFEIFIQARHEWRSMQRHRMLDSLQDLMRAVSLDPTLTAAREDIVHLCTALSLYGFLQPTVAAQHIRKIAAPSAELPQGLESVLPTLGWTKFHIDHDLTGALSDFALSSHLPHSTMTTQMRVLFAMSRQRFGEAISILESALKIDPYSPWLHARLALALNLAGESQKAVSHAEQAFKLFPTHEGAVFYGSIVFCSNGMSDRAIELSRGLTNRLTYFDLATATQAYALSETGKKDDARAILERLQWMGRERYVLNSFLPQVHVSLGDHASAIAELNNALEARCPWFFIVLADPRLKPLHGNPEFEKLRAILPDLEAVASERLNAGVEHFIGNFPEQELVGQL